MDVVAHPFFVATHIDLIHDPFCFCAAGRAHVTYFRLLIFYSSTPVGTFQQLTLSLPTRPTSNTQTPFDWKMTNGRNELAKDGLQKTEQNDQRRTFSFVVVQQFFNAMKWKQAPPTVTVTVIAFTMGQLGLSKKKKKHSLRKRKRPNTTKISFFFLKQRRRKKKKSQYSLPIIYSESLMIFYGWKLSRSYCFLVDAHAFPFKNKVSASAWRTIANFNRQKGKSLT